MRMSRLWCRSSISTCGKHIANFAASRSPRPAHCKGLPIVLALQNVRFRLDEHGAILKSEAAMAAEAADRRSLAQFIFDKPFLILLERKDAAQPYFALWVDNPELLAPFE